jgi:formylglycine-generating enzyme required for sulfatase activity
MIGNVREWCADFWANNVADFPEEGAPSGPSGDYLRRNPFHGIYRAQRGGSWDVVPRFLRSAQRGGGDLAIGVSNVGFRLYRTL